MISKQQSACAYIVFMIFCHYDPGSYSYLGSEGKKHHDGSFISIVHCKSHIT